MQSVPITTKVMSLNPAHGEVYSIQLYVIKFVSDLIGTPVSSTNKTDRHDITEIFLKLALNTWTPNPKLVILKQHKKCVMSFVSITKKDALDSQSQVIKLQLLAHGQWFSPGTPASSTTKIGCHDIAEILLKVALNTKNQSIICLNYLINRSN